MARYFRCEEPTRQCPHALTHEVLLDHEGVCPIGNPDCERHRRPVSTWAALLERHPKRIWSGVTLIAILLIVLLLTALFTSSGWKGEHDDLRSQLASLDMRLDALESQATSSFSAPLDTPTLQQLQMQAVELQRAVQMAHSGNAGPEAVHEFQTQWQALDSRTANLTLPVGGDLDVVTRQTAARQLVVDYERIEEQAETLRFKLPPGDVGAEQAYDDLTAAIIDGMSRAQRLSAPAAEVFLSPDQLALIEQIKTTLNTTRETIESLAAKPVQPFPIESAGLVVVASPAVAENLVLPLLRERFDGTVTAAQADPPVWFIATTDPVASPGAVLTSVSDDPYAHLIDGSADLVFSDRPADASTMERFAQTFDNANLASRAFSEIIALDAVAILAHPDAPIVPISPTNLSNEPWMVRASDAEVIQRLTFGTARVQPVEDPFSALLADPNARVLALYHQCGPGLAARYLPYQPAADAPALATSPFSIATEDYGLAFRITTAHAPNVRPSARQFIEFLKSDPGQEKIATTGFVDLRLQHQQGTVDPIIMATLAKAVGQESINSASRYSTNLRFALNEHELDIKAQADMGRLPRSLAKDFPNGTVVVLGFTDSTGTAAGNHALSVKRADHVAKRLREFKINAEAAGLGQQFPIDTNDTDQGRSRNRRVEVWVVQ